MDTVGDVPLAPGLSELPRLGGPLTVRDEADLGHNVDEELAGVELGGDTELAGGVIVPVGCWRELAIITNDNTLRSEAMRRKKSCAPRF